MSDEKNGGAHLRKVTRHPDGGDSLKAVIQRIVAMLEALLKKDEPGHIDLGQLNLSLEERRRLAEMLGENGTRAETFDYGHSQISSTGIPGVWWVRHLDNMEHVIGEFIEVNYCPEALIVAGEDIREGQEALKARLFEAQMMGKRRN